MAGEAVYSVSTGCHKVRRGEVDDDVLQGKGAMAKAAVYSAGLVEE